MAARKQEARLSEDDFKRLERAMEKICGSVIDKHVPPLVRREISGIGLLVSDEDDRVEATKDILFLRKIRQGAEAAESLIGKRVMNGFLWLLGVLLAMGSGALLHLLYSSGK